MVDLGLQNHTITKWSKPYRKSIVQFTNIEGRIIRAHYYFFISLGFRENTWSLENHVRLGQGDTLDVEIVI